LGDSREEMDIALLLRKALSELDWFLKEMSACFHEHGDESSKSTIAENLESS
jgi:hypothetical protein